ncbi:MAG TPA: ABC transporter substrate-binding protein [candidate division Zixibacteria bacterium]|nr:ABC transporter substrate-binding protein [candidate division Zixibacteria bacterium]
MSVIDTRARYLSFVYLVFLLVSGALSGCGDSAGTWQRIQESGTIRVGLDPTYPPFESMKDGVLQGIDIDLTNAIADDLDLRVDYSHFGYDGLYDALFTGQVDVLISAMVVLPEKTRDFAYSSSYYDAGQILVSRAESVFHTLDEASESTIAVELGSEGHVLANQWKRKNPGATVIPFKNVDEAVRAVENRKADVAITDSITGRLLAAQSPELKLGNQTISAEPFALVVRSGDEVLLDRLNSSLENLQKDGNLDLLIRRWLNNNSSENQ